MLFLRACKCVQERSGRRKTTIQGLPPPVLRQPPPHTYTPASPGSFHAPVFPQTRIPAFPRTLRGTRARPQVSSARSQKKGCAAPSVIPLTTNPLCFPPAHPSDFRSRPLCTILLQMRLRGVCTADLLILAAQAVLSLISEAPSVCSAYSSVLNTAYTFTSSRSLFFSTLPFHAKVFLLATDTIFVPSMYRTFSDTSPYAFRISTTCLNSTSNRPSDSLSLLNRLIVLKSGLDMPESHM